MNIFCMIPARIGRQRLKYKNLALIKDKALIEYSILNAINTNIFEKIFINSDSDIFNFFCKKYKIEFYKRKKKYAISSAKSDDVIYDFLINNKINNGLLVWLNPIAPLLNEKIIKEVINKFIKLKLSSAITSNTKQVHAICENKNINFNKKEKFAKTQDLNSVSLFNYAIMIWDIEKFKQKYIKNNYCFFIDKFANINIPEHNSFIVKTAYDLKIVENFINYEKKLSTVIKYHKQIKYL